MSDDPTADLIHLYRDRLYLRIDRLVAARRVTGAWTEEEITNYRQELEASYFRKDTPQ